MKSGCVLLEPYYKFRIEVPNENVGRVMSDLQAKFAEFEIESSDSEQSVIVGKAPVSELIDYTRELISFTRGKGRISCVTDGYLPCHNAEEITSEVGYDPEGDLDNTPHSVFCAHGAGFVVPWHEVDSYKHLDAGISLSSSASVIPKAASLAKKYKLSNEELEAIMLRLYGPIKRRRYSEPKAISVGNKEKPAKSRLSRPPRHMIIVDGYNLIYSNEDLKATSLFSLEKAREELMDILSNYVSFTKKELLLVFDA
jgi:hypothetical protein